MMKAALWISFILLLMPSLRADESYAARVDFGARLEPKARIIHGAGQDIRGFSDYSGCFEEGRRPLVYMTYIGLCSPVGEVSKWGERLRGELDSFRPARLIPQIGLNFTVGNDQGVGRDADVAAGKYDAQLRAFADAVLALKRPVFIRIGYEFEGKWNNYKPKTFVATWIHVARYLRARGVPFAGIWCAAGASSGWPALRTLLQYYPGDAWVDWWGVDLFSEDEFTLPQLATFLDAARAHRKPVMIGEMTPRYVGVLAGEKSWRRWFAPLLHLLKTRPEIKGTAYINWDWAEWSDRLGFGWHDWGDARLEKNEFLRKAWAGALADPIFLNAPADASMPLPLNR